MSLEVFPPFQLFERGGSMLIVFKCFVEFISEAIWS